jgi:dipeptidyl aminopeptidase/acylaminoacyl peptidase
VSKATDLTDSQASLDASYKVPSGPLLKAVGSPELPSFRPNHQDTRLLVTWSSRYLSLEDLRQPEKRLAGLRFHPELRCSVRQSFINNLEIHDLRDGRYSKSVSVTGLPRKLRALDPIWSPDGERFSLIVVQKRSCSLWVVEASTGAAKQVTARQPQGINGFDVEWLDSQSLICLVADQSATRRISRKSETLAPSIQEHQHQKQTARTYQDLLKSEHDCAELEFYLTSVPLRIELLSAQEFELCEPGLYLFLTASPGRNHLLLDSVVRPFSYSVPLAYFPRKTEVIDLRNLKCAPLLIRALPLQENVPSQFDSVRPGRRLVQWQACSERTLCWVEALDGGDSTAPASARDRLFQAEVPDVLPPSLSTWLAGCEDGFVWGDLQGRLSRILWGEKGLAIIEEHWWKTRSTRRHWCQLEPSDGGRAHSRKNQVWNLMSDLCWEDSYNDPGRPLVRADSDGRKFLVQDLDKNSIFLVSEGASPEGNRPFLDEWVLSEKGASSRRLFQSQAPYFAYPWRYHPASQELLLTRESRTEPPNLFSLTLTEIGAMPRQLTFVPNSFPEMQSIEKQLISYGRADGVDLSGTLYLPSHSSEPRPLLLWVYPGEIKNAALAGQVEDSPYRYLRPFWGGAMLFALLGYAVLEYPSFPIVGEGDAEPNDTYIEQLVSSAEAAIDYLVSAGLVDRDRCAVGGHSYGAFTVANLLAHSRLFRCGIARSGAYNRTLTPFGFQSEERNFWEAKAVYHRLSPFENCDQTEGALLLIHGADDNNSGTHSMQSERFYQALKGLGKPARLVMLPYESHSYQARESILHVLFEMERFLEQNLKF